MYWRSPLLCFCYVDTRIYLNGRGTFETIRPGSLWRRIFGAIDKDGKNNPNSNPAHPRPAPSKSVEEQERRKQEFKRERGSKIKSKREGY